MFLEISQNSQENTSVRVSFLINFNKFIRKETWHWCFPVNFANILRTPFFHRTPLEAASETSIENKNTFGGKITYNMGYVVVFSV